jgi:predicted DNA-binding protein (UPF0251 family)
MTDAAQSTEDRYALRSVSRALDVLEALGKAGNEGMTVAGVAEQIGVSKSTAFALLHYYRRFCCATSWLMYGLAVHAATG